MPILLKKKKEKNPQKTQSSDSQPGRGLLLLALGQGLWTAASQPAASVLCSCPHSTRFSATHTLLGKPLDSGGGGTRGGGQDSVQQAPQLLRQEAGVGRDRGLLKHRIVHSKAFRSQEKKTLFTSHTVSAGLKFTCRGWSP